MTNYVAYNVSEDSETVKLIAQAIEKAGHTPHTALGGGGSDANVLAGHGYRSVILGLGMRDVHTVQESLDMDEVWKAARVIRRMMSGD